ncbi:MAG: thiol oxidoreductase [Gammaproteobacteria bacterium]|nr:thiol oxidoreductase [Gammaproteobacteria bacterium]
MQYPACLLRYGLLTVALVWFAGYSALAAQDVSAVAGKRLYSQSVPGLSADQRLDFMVGRGIFRRLWVTAPASTQAADGLGPLYNARSCAACHPDNGRGRAMQADDAGGTGLVLRIDVPAQDAVDRQRLATHRINNVSEPSYGVQLQDAAIPGHRAEHRLAVDFEESTVTLGDGETVTLRRPRYRVEDLGYGPLHAQARLSPRLAPQLIGLGLIEAIRERDILAREDPDDADGDGISGRANRVWHEATGQVMLGRFGHKAGMPDVDQQVQSAFATDLGLSVPLYPAATGDCSGRQADCMSAPNGNSPQYDDLEAHRTVTDLVGSYVSHLAVPARRAIDMPDVIAGERLFSTIGCQACHTPAYRTGDQTASPATHHRDIAPYTDLLLHDMGEGLADDRPEGIADGREWRTAPLWGIGLTSAVSGDTGFLHDGRARSLLEAILWHGGEAQTQRDAVVALDRRSREQLLAFIRSL